MIHNFTAPTRAFAHATVTTSRRLVAASPHRICQRPRSKVCVLQTTTSPTPRVRRQHFTAEKKDDTNTCKPTFSSYRAGIVLSLFWAMEALTIGISFWRALFVKFVAAFSEVSGGVFVGYQVGNR